MENNQFSNLPANEQQPNQVSGEVKIEEHVPKPEDANYVNTACCQVSIPMMVAYIFLFSSISLTLIIRTLFGKYLFRFNFTLLVAQQLICLIFFVICSKKSTAFKRICGEVSFLDFKKLWGKYIIFSLLFMANQLSSFYGGLLVKNTVMFLTLRKFSFIFTFFYEFFVEKKKIEILNILSMLLIAGGSLLVGLDDFTADYIGYLVVIVNNLLTLAYSKYGEFFRKKNKVPNLKCLVYNSFIVQPVCLCFIFGTGEFFRFKNYILSDEMNDKYSFLYIRLSALVVGSGLLAVVLNSSFMISNEKNSSFFTQLLGSTKDIFISVFTYFLLKDFNVSVKTISGMILNTTGAVLISLKSLMKAFKKKAVDVKEEVKIIEIKVDEDQNKKEIELGNTIGVIDESPKDSK